MRLLYYQIRQANENQILLSFSWNLPNAPQHRKQMKIFKNWNEIILAVNTMVCAFMKHNIITDYLLFYIAIFKKIIFKLLTKLHFWSVRFLSLHQLWRFFLLLLKWMHTYLFFLSMIVISSSSSNSTWDQFYQTFCTQRKCTNSHSFIPFSFTNKIMPNSTSTHN